MILQKCNLLLEAGNIERESSFCLEPLWVETMYVFGESEVLVFNNLWRLIAVKNLDLFAIIGVHKGD